MPAIILIFQRACEDLPAARPRHVILVAEEPGDHELLVVGIDDLIEVLLNALLLLNVLELGRFSHPTVKVGIQRLPLELTHHNAQSFIHLLLLFESILFTLLFFFLRFSLLFV